MTDMTRYILQSPLAMLNLARELELVLDVDVDMVNDEPENEERVA